MQDAPSMMIWKNALRTRASIIARIAGWSLLFAPVFIAAFAASFRTLARWRRADVREKFLRRHAHAFGGDEHDLSAACAESKCGGVSNSNQMWRLKRRSGGVSRYFAKVYLPIGGFWAQHLPRVSPFPHIGPRGERERLVLDANVRQKLERLGVGVPKQVVLDEAECVSVTEWHDGQSVDAMLCRAASRGRFEDEDERMIRSCGEGLARAHAGGVSIVDSQPVNCLWDGDRVIFTDFEYASDRDRRAWDSAFFLSFLTLRLGPRLERAGAAAFAEGYASHAPFPEAEVRAELSRLEGYRPVFETILELRRYTPEELACSFFGSREKAAV